MNKKILILIFSALYLCLANFSCTHSRVTASQERNPEEAIMHLESDSDIENNSEVYFILSSKTIVKIDASKAPSSFYIKGTMEAGKFIPKSEILGQGHLAHEGRYGWLELHSKSFFPMESDRKALSPFVKGYENAKGSFVPSEREVIIVP